MHSIIYNFEKTPKNLLSEVLTCKMMNFNVQMILISALNGAPL